jgi:hypothetical protein
VDNRPNLVGKSAAAVEDCSGAVGTIRASDASDLTLRHTLGAAATQPARSRSRDYAERLGRPSSIPESALLRGYGLDPDTLDPIR